MYWSVFHIEANREVSLLIYMNKLTKEVRFNLFKILIHLLLFHIFTYFQYI